MYVMVTKYLFFLKSHYTNLFSILTFIIFYLYCDEMCGMYVSVFIQEVP